MSDLFDIHGANLDLGFENLKVAEFPIEQQLHAMPQEMWARYEPYADPNFRQGFARDVDGRLQVKFEVPFGIMGVGARHDHGACAEAGGGRS